MNTIAFSNKGSFWKTRYSFLSSCFAYLDKLFFSSTRLVDDGRAFWKHNSPVVGRNSFYDLTYSSYVGVTFNQNPSVNKVFKSFSIEGTTNIAGLSGVFISDNSSANATQPLVISQIEERGGILYGDIGSMTKVTGTNIKAIGRINRIRERNNLNGYPPSPGNSVYQIRVDSFLSPNPIPASRQAKLFIVKNSDTELFTRASNEYSPINAVTDAGGVSEADGDFIENPNFILDRGFDSYLTLGELYLGENSFKSGNNIYVEFNQLNPDHAPSLAPIEWSVDADGVPNPTADYDFLAHEPIHTVPSVTDLDEEEFQLELNANIAFFNADDYILYSITPSITGGDDPKGQYANAIVSLGAGNFELYSLNMEYEPTNYDHRTSSPGPAPKAKSRKSAKRKR